MRVVARLRTAEEKRGGAEQADPRAEETPERRQACSLATIVGAREAREAKAGNTNKRLQRRTPQLSRFTHHTVPTYHTKYLPHDQ